jgi:3-hydroxyacyl-[acyl-carrier-protein] dehydratase
MNDIYQTIPHRPPFLFIDAIKTMRDDGAIAVRTFRADESFYEGHYPGNPITPGVLLCESVFQTGAVYLVKRLEKEGGSAAGKTPVLSRIKEAKFKNMVKPGATVEIEVIHQETLGQFHFLRGTVKQEGKLALSLEFALALIG